MSQVVLDALVVGAMGDRNAVKARQSLELHFRPEGAGRFLTATARRFWTETGGSPSLSDSLLSLLSGTTNPSRFPSSSASSSRSSSEESYETSDETSDDSFES